MRRLGMPVSDDTLLRHVKRVARDARPAEPLRVVGVEERAALRHDIGRLGETRRRGRIGPTGHL